MKDLSEIAREAAETIVLGPTVYYTHIGDSQKVEFAQKIILHSLEAATGGVTAAAVEKLGQATLTGLRAKLESMGKLYVETDRLAVDLSRQLEQARKDGDALNERLEWCYKYGLVRTLGAGEDFNYSPIDRELLEKAYSTARQAAGEEK